LHNVRCQQPDLWAHVESREIALDKPVEPFGVDESGSV